MNNSPDRMGTAPIGKLLFTMSWPSILSMTINALYNVVDSIFVAKLSQDALAAVSFVMPMQLLMISITVGSGVGVNSLIARCLGSRNHDIANNAATTGIGIGIFNYVIFLLIGLFVTEPFMGHYTSDPIIFNYGTTYMKLVMCLSLFSAMEIIISRIMQATGNMKSPMICSMAGAITNTVLDPILIFGLLGAPRLGVAGAAIATIIGQAVAFLLALIFIARQKIIKIDLSAFKPEWKVIKDIYAVGLPAMVMQAIGSVMMIGYNSIIASEKTAVAVLGIYQKLQSFIFMPVFGFNQGSMPIMGYNYGARNKERLVNTYKYALIIALIIMAFGLAIFQIFPQFFLKLFNADENMLAIGVPALRRISLCFIPAAFGIITSSVFQATGHAVYSLISSLIRQLIGILPLAYILYRVGGAAMSWFSFPLAEILGVVYLGIMIVRFYNKKIKFLGEE